MNNLYGHFLPFIWENNGKKPKMIHQWETGKKGNKYSNVGSEKGETTQHRSGIIKVSLNLGPRRKYNHKQFITIINVQHFFVVLLVLQKL